MDSRHARIMAVNLMHQHGLRGWVFDYDNAKRHAGVCIPHIRTIRLSEPWVNLNADADVKQVILHEIAHALVPSVRGANGRMNRHGAAWLAKAREIGYTGGTRTEPHTRSVERTWRATCSCGQTYSRDRKRAGLVYYCPPCAKMRTPENPRAGALVWVNTKTGKAEPLPPLPSSVPVQAAPKPRVSRARTAVYGGRGAYDRGFTNIEQLFGD